MKDVAKLCAVLLYVIYYIYIHIYVCVNISTYTTYICVCMYLVNVYCIIHLRLLRTFIYFRNAIMSFNIFYF